MLEFESESITIFVGGLLIAVKRLNNPKEYLHLIGKTVLVDGLPRKVRAVQFTTLPEKLQKTHMGLVI